MLELANMTQDFMKNIRNNKKEYAQHCYYSENKKGKEYNGKKKKKKKKKEKSCRVCTKLLKISF